MKMRNASAKKLTKNISLEEALHDYRKEIYYNSLGSRQSTNFLSQNVIHAASASLFFCRRRWPKLKIVRRILGLLHCFMHEKGGVVHSFVTGDFFRRAFISLLMEDGSSCPYKCKWENSVFG